MRILITSDVFPPEVGGPATHGVTIARGLVELGHQVHVLTCSCGNPGAAHEEAYPFELERIDVLQPGWRRRVTTAVRLVAHLRWADVVYVNGLLVETSRANRLLRKPAVARVVGDLLWERAVNVGWTEDEFELFQRRRYEPRIERPRQRRNRALHRMRAVTVPSTYLKRVVTGWGAEERRVQVVHDAYEAAPPGDTAWRVPLTTRYRVLTAGRLTAWKGVDDLLAAIIPLQDVGLVVVGDGPQRSLLESMALRMRLQQRVHFAGTLSRPALTDAMRECDLFVLNSRYEGFPHVVLEAFAARLPVVAAAVGGVLELIEDGTSGRLVPVGDRPALRSAIRQALDDVTARQAWRTAGRAALERFTPQAMIGRTAEILEATLQ
jgi:glycosyltransferase involved in cell wall biosynthesis